MPARDTELMARLIAAIMRHGDYHQLANTPSALQPFPLTAQGCEQARQGAASIAGFLRQQQCELHSAIDSSQLLRGWQTARIVADALKLAAPASQRTGIDVQGYEDLAERSVGSAANLTLQQIEEILQADPRYRDPPTDWKSNSHYCLPLQGAESLMQAGERVAAHLEKQMQGLFTTETSDTLKLFVGHGAAFRHAAYCMGLLVFEDIAKLSMHHAQPLFFEFNARAEADSGESRWRHIDGEWKVRSKNTVYTD
ncbi:histidine phosphatase family protein [Ketobacter sp. MCCC 1A13808]|uniref:histidine phosphatase family protein n=1 Tax=Ketobacter sp. MCCC 1A13808 TaxID=2602738 RepID=UPI0012EBB552|nr:histidine phosphatase family protein [Ketobacter sp. MCCC 1A13808]MVF12048.1 histidine phosphatase family protein [Ketobacter sp. MCCC 1A13808]